MDRFVAATVGWDEPLQVGSHHGDVELALVDAVVTPQRFHGVPTTPDGPAAQAWACIEHWRELRGEAGTNDLVELAAHLGRQDVMDDCLAVDDSRVPGSSPERLRKWEAVRDVAAALAGSGAHTAAHVRYAVGQNVDAVGSLITDVKGVGEVTRDYFLLPTGAPLTAADDAMRAFVAEALGDVPRGTGDEDDVTAEEAAHLLWVVAEQRQVDLAALQHAVWSTQKRARRQARAN